MAQTRTVAQLLASQSCDSIALVGSPIIDATSNSISQSAVIGTYALQKDTQQTPHAPPIRHGSAQLVLATRTDSSYALTLQDQLAMPAVLDVVTDPSNSVDDPAVLYAACAEAAIFRLVSTAPYTQLRSDAIVAADASSAVLNLSLHAAHEAASSRTLLAYSDSTGRVCTRRAAEGGFATVSQFRAHDAEAWAVHITEAASRAIVMSGGDDGVLTAHAVADDAACWRRRNAHGGVGVTCIAARPHRPHELWTGGYDDHVRVWDTRAMKQCAHELDVCGGVWRIRFHPAQPDVALIAAMYDGCKVVRLSEGAGLELVSEYPGHTSIAYGAEWVAGLDHADELVALTASFYDYQVRLWTHREN